MIRTKVIYNSAAGNRDNLAPKYNPGIKKPYFCEPIFVMVILRYLFFFLLFIILYRFFKKWLTVTTNRNRKPTWKKEKKEKTKRFSEGEYIDYEDITKKENQQ